MADIFQNPFSDHTHTHTHTRLKDTCTKTHAHAYIHRLGELCGGLDDSLLSPPSLPPLLGGRDSVANGVKDGGSRNNPPPKRRRRKCFSVRNRTISAVVNSDRLDDNIDINTHDIPMCLFSRKHIQLHFFIFVSLCCPPVIAALALALCCHTHTRRWRETQEGGQRDRGVFESIRSGEFGKGRFLVDVLQRPQYSFESLK